jgi:hypothetical protein
MTWEANGVRWIFVVHDQSPANGRAYLERYGVDFGWVTNDLDNSEGSNALLMSGLIYGTPWVGAVCADAMRLVGHDGDWSFSMTGAAQDCAER